MTSKHADKESVWCPACLYFSEDCGVDPEDYDKPCDSFVEDETYPDLADLDMES